MSGLMLAALLLGQAAEPGAASVETADAPESLRTEYTALAERFSRGRRPEPAEVVGPLCDLHRRLDADETLSHAERRRLLHGVERRLVELRGRMLREPTRGRRDRDTSLAGGTPAAAQELIRLIEMTVAPETWAANGGRGTIVFWSQSPTLVIRQTGEVHHQIGATLGAVRQAQ